MTTASTTATPTDQVDAPAPTAPNARKSKQPRLSINLNQDAAEFLEDITSRRDISITEAVRRALSLYKLLDDHMEAGDHVQIDDGKRVRELVIV